MLEHLQCHGAVVVGGLGESAVIAFPNPALVGGGIVARQRQPHQAAGGLPRQPVAGEQHLAEHRLRLMLALLGCQTKPARSVAEVVPRGVRRLQVKPRQIVLRVGIAEIGRGIGKHLPGAIGVRLDLGIRDAVEVVASQRHEGVGDDRRLRRRRAVLGMRVGDAAEIFEGAQIVLDDAIAIGIHPAELPLRGRR